MKEINRLNETSPPSESFKVAFKASMDPNLAVAIPGSTERCFGPFNTDVPIPYSSVSLNDGNGYNPSLGKTHRKTQILQIWLTSSIEPSSFFSRYLHGVLSRSLHVFLHGVFGRG